MPTEFFIKYYPAIADVLGSSNAALLLAKLEHLSACMGHQKFYKFLEPCAHDFYEVGQSLTEELGLSENQIRTALDSFCVTYNGKNHFNENVRNLFNINNRVYLYCRLLDKRAGLTYYYRNHIQVDKFLKDINVNLGYKVNIMRRDKAMSRSGHAISVQPHKANFIQINNKNQNINNKKQMDEIIKKFEHALNKTFLRSE